MERLTPASPQRQFVSRWREIGDRLEGLRPVRITVAASYTVEPLVPYLGCFLSQRGIGAVITVAPYNQIYQTLLDPAGPLRLRPPEVAIVLPRVEELCGRALAGLAKLDAASVAAARAEASGEIARLCAAFGDVERATAGKTVLFCSTLPPPDTTPLGPLDADHPASLRALHAELNLSLWNAAQGSRGLRLFDLAEVVERVGKRAAYDPRSYYLSRCPFSHELLRQAGHELARAVAPLFVAPAKVVVLDLDNTLWGGVVGEDGIGGIAVGESGIGAAFAAFQDGLLALRRQGVLLCVASKNNEADALEVLDEHPGMRIRREHLAAFRIGWGKKSDSLSELARELGLGLSSFVFVDDSPFEREEVRTMLPEVHVVDLPEDPARYLSALRAVPELDRMVLTAEDYRRAEAYAIERQREALRPKDAGTDPAALAAYLASLDLRVAVRRIGEADVPRAAQLTQKTNQFNLTTIRRSEAEVEALRKDARWRLFALDVADRFDEYGTTGLLFARRLEDDPAAFSLDTLLLSCRVLGRNVETALFGAALSDLVAAGARRVFASFVPTEKNAPAAGCLEAHGFRAEPGGGYVLSPIDLARYRVPHVAVRAAWPIHPGDPAPRSSSREAVP